MWGLSPVAASGGHSSSRCAGLSLSWPLLLRSTGSTRAGSVVVAHGPSWSAACGIFPDQGSNPCPLHWQADSQPVRHQGSPCLFFFNWAVCFLVVEFQEYFIYFENISFIRYIFPNILFQIFSMCILFLNVFNSLSQSRFLKNFNCLTSVFWFHGLFFCCCI